MNSPGQNSHRITRQSFPCDYYDLQSSQIFFFWKHAKFTVEIIQNGKYDNIMFWVYGKN